MAAGIVIISWWVTQFWFPLMVPLFQDFSVVRTPEVLILLSNKGLHHPMYPKMKLPTVHLLGKLSDTKNFHQQLLKLLWNRGDHQQGPDMSQCLNDGTTMRYRVMTIPILHK